MSLRRFLIRLVNAYWCAECREVHLGHCRYCWKWGCGDCTCDYPYRFARGRR